MEIIRRITPEEEYNAGLVIFRQGGVHPLEDSRSIGFEVAASPLLLDTLCACFDNLDSKTGACEQLGIRRQTLYNRLDKVTQMVGVDYNDKPNWSMLLFAAKLTKSWQEQHGE